MKRVGLDIGVTHVRVAEVEYPGKQLAPGAPVTLTGFAQVPIPRGAVVGGDVLDAGAVSSALKKAVSGAGLSTKEVVVGVGSESVIVREIEVPEMPMAQLRTSLPFQVSEMLPMSPSEALLDFYPTQQKVDGTTSVLRGILVAAPRQAVSQKLLAVEGAGLRAVGVDLNGFAILRSQLTAEDAQRVVAFVDIGGRTTNVVIAQGGQPRLVRTLSSGGNDITDALASALHVDLGQADDIKMRLGLSEQADATVPGSGEPIMSTTRSLVDAIRNTFVYFSSSNPGEGIGVIVISGGGSYLPGLGQFLASMTRLPVKYGNAFSRVTLGKNVKPESINGLEARVSTVMGLAMGEATA